MYIRPTSVRYQTGKSGGIVYVSVGLDNFRQ